MHQAYFFQLGRIARFELVHAGFTVRSVKPLHHIRHKSHLFSRTMCGTGRSHRLVDGLTVVVFDDVGFVDLGSELVPLRKTSELSFELVAVKLDVCNTVGGLLEGFLYYLERLGGILEGDDGSDLGEVGRYVHLLSIHEDVSVVDELPGLPTGGCKSKPVDDVVETLLADLHECESSQSLGLLCDSEVSAELTLGDSVGEAELLLFEQLLSVFGRLLLAVLSMLSRSIGTLCEFLASSQGRITEMSGNLPDRSSVT